MPASEAFACARLGPASFLRPSSAKRSERPVDRPPAAAKQASPSYFERYEPELIFAAIVIGAVLVVLPGKLFSDFMTLLRSFLRMKR